MSEPRAGVTEGLEKEKTKATPNGATPAVEVAKSGSPTHVAIPIEVWKATLDTLSTLPYAQVEQLIPAIRTGAPITLTGE